MPVTWTITTKAPDTLSGAFVLRDDARAFHLHLSPHLSMGPRGFVRVMTFCAVFLALPLLGVLGTPVLWGLLPFMGLALWGLWTALTWNQRDRLRLAEDLHLTPDAITIRRENPRQPAQEWQGNPYWTSLHLREKGGPVENYLTVKGAGREVELGAFLSPEERAQLHDDLTRALQLMRQAGVR